MFRDRMVPQSAPRLWVCQGDGDNGALPGRITHVPLDALVPSSLSPWHVAEGCAGKTKVARKHPGHFAKAGAPDGLCREGHRGPTNADGLLPLDGGSGG